MHQYFLDVVSKSNNNNVLFQQARMMHSMPILTKKLKEEDRNAIHKIEN